MASYISRRWAVTESTLSGAPVVPITACRRGAHRPNDHAERCAPIFATASIPRRTGHRVESDTTAADRITVQRSGLRQEPTDQVLGGLNRQSIARRLAAVARSAGIKGRIIGHSGRVGLASELTARAPAPPRRCLPGAGNRPHGRPLQRRGHRQLGRRRQVPVKAVATCAETHVRTFDVRLCYGIPFRHMETFWTEPAEEHGCNPA